MRGRALHVYEALTNSRCAAVARVRACSVLLLALTLPWLDLWPAWFQTMIASLGASLDAIPLVFRLPFVAGLLLLRRPWARAAAAALATPAFYFHSWVLLYPTARLITDRHALGDPTEGSGGPASADHASPVQQVT